MDSRENIKELKPGNRLKDTNRPTTLETHLTNSEPIIPVPQTVSTPQPEPLLGPVVTNVMQTASAPSSTASSSPSSSPSPREEQMFDYEDIDIKSVAGLAQHITYGDQMQGIFDANSHLKQCVRLALEESVQEMLPPVVERTLKIALRNCEQILRKDFALDPDENRMRQAARHMISSTISGLALYTCREPLFLAISNNITKAFMNLLARENFSEAQLRKEMTEQDAQLIAKINTALASAFIQKTAVERAINEIEKSLASDFASRKVAREKGITYYDPVVLTYQAEWMPEQIRLKVGEETPRQIAVYEEFARNIPGFLPIKESPMQAGVTKPVPEVKPGNNPNATCRLTTLEPHLARSEPIIPVPETVSKPQPDHLSDPIVMNVTPKDLAPPPSMPAYNLPSSSPSLAEEDMVAYEDIDTKYLTGLYRQIKYCDDTRNLFKAKPQLKKCIRDALFRSVLEILNPVVERLLKISLRNCKQIMKKKDFARDPDEDRMRQAARHMICSTTSRLALSFCRKSLFTAMSNNLKNNVLNLVANPTNQQKEAIEHAAKMTAKYNMALAVPFIQNTAVERSFPEIEQILAAIRKVAREKGFRYYNPVVLTYQAGRMTDSIRLKVGWETSQQMAVYEEFARHSHGFLPIKRSPMPFGATKSVPELKPCSRPKETSRLTTLEPNLSDSKPIMPVPNTVSQPQPGLLSDPVVTNVTPTDLAPAPPMPASDLPSYTPSLAEEDMVAYEDIDTKYLAGLSQHIKYSDDMRNLFQAKHQLQKFIRDALVRSVQEILSPVVERLLKISLRNCEQILKKKDFALDPDENRMRQAARHMICSTTSRLALSFCRKPLFMAMSNNLKNNVLTLVANPTHQQKEAIEHAAKMTAKYNMAVAVPFIQNTAVKRALHEIERILADIRKVAREKGLRYCDPVVSAYQAAQQMAVLEELRRHLPPFLSIMKSLGLAGVTKAVSSNPTTEAVLEKVALVYPPRFPNQWSTRGFHQSKNHPEHELSEMLGWERCPGCERFRRPLTTMYFEDPRASPPIT